MNERIERLDRAAEAGLEGEHLVFEFLCECGAGERGDAGTTTNRLVRADLGRAAAVPRLLGRKALGPLGTVRLPGSTDALLSVDHDGNDDTSGTDP